MILILRHIGGAINYDEIVRVRRRFLKIAKGEFSEIQAGLSTVFFCKRSDITVSETPTRVRIEELTHPHVKSSDDDGSPYGQGFILDLAKEGTSVRIASDMLNTRPFFYTRDTRMLASHLMLLEPDSAKIDMDVLHAMLLMTYNPFFGKTLFTDIAQTSAGKNTLFEGTQVEETIAENNILNEFPSRPELSIEAFGDWLAEAYPRLVNQFLGPWQTHTLISGGADSRGLLSVLYNLKAGRIHGHSYGPSMFFDNMLANEACQRLPGVTHSIHDFDNGSAILSTVDDVLLHSNLSARFDDTFRNFLISRNISEQAPVLYCLAVDSLFGDETYPGVSNEIGFLDGYRKGPFRCLSDFLAFAPGLTSSLISNEEKERLDKLLLEHYSQELGLEKLSEQDGYDLLNVLCRHGKGTVGMLSGMAAFHQPVIPLLNGESVNKAFRLGREARYLARGYLDSLFKRIYREEHKDLITTRGMISLDELLRNNFTISSQEEVSPRERIFYRDYYQLFYLTNSAYRQFIGDNVSEFNRRGICGVDIMPLLNSPTHSRHLLSIAMLNHYLGTH